MNPIRFRLYTLNLWSVWTRGKTLSRRDLQLTAHVSRTINFIFLAVLQFSVVAGILYGVLTQDWGSAFTLCALIVACFASFLALFSAYQYLGLERLVDDDITSRADGVIKLEEGQGLLDI